MSEIVVDYSIASRVLAVSLTVALFLPSAAQGLDTYTISMKDAVTSSDEKIRWAFPGGGTVRVTAEGLVTVDSIRQEDNACLDASTFSYQGHAGPAAGGVRSAGSNLQDGNRTIDGDPNTSWSPAAGSSPDGSWIEIDLGRATVAKAIRLVFAPGHPPFSGFRIYVSTGELRFPQSALKTLLYEQVFQSTTPNTEQVFEHAFNDVRDEQGGPLSGKYVHYVKIFLTGGAPTSGLAEVEVRTIGQNIALRTLDRGGMIVNGMALEAAKLFDGLLWSNWQITNLGEDWLQGETNGPWFNWDLGSHFWVTRLKLSTEVAVGPASGGPVDGFQILSSDGTEAFVDKGKVWKAGGRDLEWEQIADINNKASRLHEFEIPIDPPRRIRYLFFHHFYGQGVWRSGYQFGAGLHELQIYGKGFLPGVSLRSPLIDLGQSRNITAISWLGSTPPGTHISLRTRTGETTVKIPRWFNSEGKEVSQSEYIRLPTFRRGRKDTVQVVDEASFSPWSSSYALPGSPFASPSPRRYLLIQADLTSDNPDAAAFLESITLTHASPCAASAVGIIEPREARPGIPERFRFTVSPSLRPGDTGFDRVRIHTPSRVENVSVSVADRQVSAAVTIGEDSLLAVLPQIVRQGTVEVAFDATVLVGGTRVSAYIADRSLAWQQVDPDTSIASATTVMLPALERDTGLLGNLSLAPQVISPNGDGLNDILGIGFTVLKVQATQAISVAIFDLRGRLVGRPLDRRGESGIYEASWDGCDEQNHPVPPGIYLCRISVGGDAGGTVSDHHIAVVY